MSALMRDWIGPVVRRELDAIKEGTAAGFKVTHGDGNYQVLMVRIREGKSIQVNEVSALLNHLKYSVDCQ
jgi:hypothetical protein